MCSGEATSNHKSVKTVVFESEFINFKEHCLFPTYDKLFYMKNIYLISQKVSFFLCVKKVLFFEKMLFCQKLANSSLVNSLSKAKNT